MRFISSLGSDGAAPRVRLETVAAHRGERPWSVMPPQKVPRSVAEPAPLPKPRILGAPEALAPGEQSTVAKPDATAAGRHRSAVRIALRRRH